MVGPPATSGAATGELNLNRAELFAALSLAIDLGLGQPAEHMLRSALIATRLSDELGLDQAQRDTVYYATLVMWIGCHADSHEYSRWFGDDIAVRRDAYLVDWNGLPYLRFLLGNVARGQPLPSRARTLATLLRDSRGNLGQMIHSHCRSAALLAEQVGLGPEVRDALAFTFERYDGAGLPGGASASAIPIEMRVAQAADMIEVHHRLYGVDGAVAMARARRGGQFDPAVVDAFEIRAAAILDDLDDLDIWAAALSQAPDRDAVVTAAQRDALLVAMGDFVDLKTPFTLGHSRGVAELASSAGRVAGRTPDEVDVLRRAGHLHDLGRIGVSNAVWSKEGALTSSEWERVRMHPYLSLRILSQVRGLDREAELACNHHERLDGSGYPHGLTGASLSPLDRLLAAAECYQSWIEPRPHRPALSEAEAAARLGAEAENGRLDPISVSAVLEASGHRPAQRRPWPGGLTGREVEILCLVAQGMSNREIAEHLVISTKTVRNHVERVYAKIGVSNRIGASMYALNHGLGRV